METIDTTYGTRIRLQLVYAVEGTPEDSTNDTFE